MPYFPPAIDAGQQSVDENGAPILIESSESFTVRRNRQLLFSRRIDIENGGRLVFSENSALIEATP